MQKLRFRSVELNSYDSAFLRCVMGYSFGDAVEHVATRKPYMSILPNLITTIEETRDRPGGDAR